MEYAVAELNPRERYKVLTSFVLPRPIAWVTSVSSAGVAETYATCRVVNRLVPAL